jgi:hypothetical protein
MLRVQVAASAAATGSAAAIRREENQSSNQQQRDHELAAQRHPMAHEAGDPRVDVKSVEVLMRLCGRPVFFQKLGERPQRR